ncbi:N-acetylmuramoyl-L-alanine amidase [Streptomyces sp. PCS3-D2]|uniref:N-acetylmuramoyl-L-alanine amidase n=1 Tax=Streptomyces sp. PCS3-D2 TaxID=1460244 RepID=UPI002729E537|nr:N-acetylmuramoyl-L-alanine amidase [Streptomyces sp. PCS3-D2]WKV74213.1 N-acetylmuramoyl-L-alanine amidase [Streptomyces sp. PCS3-D2]
MPWRHTMDLVRRSQYGLPATSPAAYIASTNGVKVHYLGSAYTSRRHDLCDDYVRAIRASHLANTTENYVDIAYNAAVCEHGTVFEGRGPHHRSGANGTAALNTRDYSVVALVAKAGGGLDTPTDAQLHGLRDAIEWLRAEGEAGNYIGGHRDGYATTCPGAPLYDWVKRGAPRPSSTPAQSTPVVDLSRLISAATVDPPKSGTPVSYAGVRTVEAALRAEGLLSATYVDGHFGTSTITAYRAWQQRCGYRGADADGIPGKSSLTRLGTAHGFTVID